MDKKTPLPLVILVFVCFIFLKTDIAEADNLSAGPLQISYDGPKIFSELNIASGSKAEKIIRVKNGGAVAHSFAIATRVIVGSFASSIMITPSIDGNNIWTESVDHLSSLREGSKIIVDKIEPNEEVSIKLTAIVSDDLGNSGQNSETIFSFVFGPEENEPALNPILSLFRSTRGQSQDIAQTAEPSPSITPSPTEGTVKGAETSTSPDNNFNPLMLLIVPAAVVASAVLLPEFAAAAGISVIAGGVTYVLASFSSGSMSPAVFKIALGIEILFLILISYLFLKHENRISRKIRGHHHRLRIR